MADTTNIETLQAQIRRDAVQVVRCTVLRRLLAEFDPQHSDLTLDYAGLLVRVRDVITTAMIDGIENKSTHQQGEEGTK